MPGWKDIQQTYKKELAAGTHEMYRVHRGKYRIRPAAQPTPVKPPQTIADVVGIGGAKPTELGRREPPIIMGGQQQGGISTRQIAGRLNERVTFDVPLPIQGINRAFSVETPLDTTSDDMLNVRPKDILEQRIRLGQRPAVIKAYAEQIGSTNLPFSASYPVVALCQIIVVE